MKTIADLEKFLKKSKCMMMVCSAEYSDAWIAEIRKRGQTKPFAEGKADDFVTAVLLAVDCAEWKLALEERYGADVHTAQPMPKNLKELRDVLAPLHAKKTRRDIVVPCDCQYCSSLGPCD